MRKAEPDFEALRALDIELLNRQLVALLKGDEVERLLFSISTRGRENRTAGECACPSAASSSWRGYTG